MCCPNAQNPRKTHLLRNVARYAQSVSLSIEVTLRKSR